MIAHRKGSRELIREINHNLVLNLIKNHHPISQIDIVRRSGLSPSTVSGIMADLATTGLVAEAGVGESTGQRGGRRPVLVRLNPGAALVVGVKLLESAIVTVITDLDATIQYQETTPLAALEDVATTPLHPEVIISRIIGAIDTAISRSGVERQQLLGIGIGISGVIQSETGVCRYSRSFPGHRDIQVAKPIADYFDLAVSIANDVRTLTVAEQWFGNVRGVAHFVLVTVGLGIGAGIVINNQIVGGSLDSAGELGHMTIVENGPPCPCGKRGCLEALASDPAIVRQAHAAIALGEQTTLATQTAVTIAMITSAANNGDKLAQQLLADAGHYLGIGIANVVNLLSPQRIIISGEGVSDGRYRLAAMQQALREHVFDGLLDDIQVEIEPTGDEVWARGAACIVLANFFQGANQRKQAIFATSE